MITRPVGAVFFDVDFTLIYPGPTFQGEGYRQFCERYGIAVDAARFPEAVRAASFILDDEQQHAYDAEIFVRYTRRIVEGMGGEGPHLDACAREIYDEWAACRHFFLYDDVMPALLELASLGLKIGLISNSHRSMDAFQEHFALRPLVAAAVSSSEHGYLKPHPSIFAAALEMAGATAGEAVMIGDSIAHDIVGARAAGMRGILVHRSDTPIPADPEISVVKTLLELPRLLRG